MLGYSISKPRPKLYCFAGARFVVRPGLPFCVVYQELEFKAAGFQPLGYKLPGICVDVLAAYAALPAERKSVAADEQLVTETCVAMDDHFGLRDGRAMILRRAPADEQQGAVCRDGDVITSARSPARRLRT